MVVENPPIVGPFDGDIAVGPSKTHFVEDMFETLLL